MEWLSEDSLDLRVDAAPWDHLVRRSAHLLQQAGCTTPDYVDAIFASIDRNGTYMLIAPLVLLAHARPEEGAVGTGISLVTTREDIPFAGDPTKPVRLFFTLAAADSDSHLALLQHLAEVLVDDDARDELLSTDDRTRVCEILRPA